MPSDFEALTAALKEITQAADRLSKIPELAEQVERLADAQEAQALQPDGRLYPDRRYNYGQVADFIGMKRASVRNISKAELPRCGRGYVLGVDIMAYRGQITYDVAEAYKEQCRERVLNEIT